ncbi:MAG: TIGR02679 family protein [Mycobacteriales bacterium]
MDRERLERLLGTEELRWLVERARWRLERGRGLDGSVTLAGASPEQRAAVQRLLGRRPGPGSAVTVSLPAVDEMLRRSGASPCGLAAAVVALTGEVLDLPAGAAAAEAAWERAVEPLAGSVAGRPELAGWLERLVATGLLRRVAGSPDVAAGLCRQLAVVISRWPAGGVPLGRFAAEVAGGDSHALDDDRPLATLALSAARTVGGLPAGSGAVWRREVWASVGVLRNELSSTVLTLGLPGDAATATGAALGAWRDAGQPVLLTLRQVVRDPPRVAVPAVHVCENPVVVAAAADRLGGRCGPLVCTAGQPGTAAIRLLTLLSRSGAALRFHGDFDWGGLRIGNLLAERLPVGPWRYGAGDYRRLVAAGLGRELPGKPVVASWDPDLTREMADLRVRVDEELVLDDLIADLAAAPSARARRRGLVATDPAPPGSE